MNNLVSEVGNFHIQGNVLDSGWFQNLRHENGKANLNAIVILSEIIYWYKPTEVRDEITGELMGYKKKFKADKLQKSYQSLAENFGLTKGQVKSACKFLKDRGLIEIEFRNVPTKSGQVLTNVMFIEPVIEEIRKISGREKILEVSNCNKPPMGIDMNTVNTTESSNENTDEQVHNSNDISIETIHIYDPNDIPTNDESTEVCASNSTPINDETTEVCSSNYTGMEFQQQTYTENTTEITTESKKKIYNGAAGKIIDFLNEKADTSYKSSSKATKKVIEARLNEGFNLNDFFKVISTKTSEWKDTDFEKYLRPQTLFGSKFEGYLNQKSYNNRISVLHRNKNPVDSFSNRKQRKYDMGSLERQLLGWE